MKRFVVFLIAALMIISLVGCFSDSNNITTVTPTVPSQNTTSTKPTQNTTTQPTIYMHPTLSTSPDYPMGYEPADIPQVYWNALNNKQAIVFPYGCHSCTSICEQSIDFYRFPYDFISIATAENVVYAVIDMDGDGNEELLLRLSDTLLLREKDGIVYGYSFVFRNMDDVFIDGSYDWFYGGLAVECGRNKLSFTEDGLLEETVLTNVYEESEDNIQYYISGAEVTADEYQAYKQTLSQTKVEWKRAARFPLRDYDAKDD